MLRFAFLSLFACSLITSPLAYAAPDADQILEVVRKSMVSQGERDVLGHIRKDSNSVPFSLSSRGDTMIFQYKEGDAWQRFDVKIKEKNVDLIKVDANKATQLAAASYTQKIAGTDVTYEDLSMRFLYWKGGKIVEDTKNSRIKGRDCYIIEIANPQAKLGSFAWVRLWLDKENGTTWRIDGYGADGLLKKRFSITSVQKLSDGSWFFKQMKLEILDPKNQNRTVALNYLEMDDLADKK